MVIFCNIYCLLRLYMQNAFPGGITMKKIFLILLALTAISFYSVGQESESEKVRLDIVMADTISTNLLSTTNTTNVGLRVGLNNNKIGILAGGMLREAFCTAELDKGLPIDYYINGTPYLGIELWNVELLGGVEFNQEFAVAPYVSLGYNIDLIKPETGFTNRLSLKLGIEYFFDAYTGAHSADSEEDNLSGLGAVAVDLFSVIIPRAYVGLQYTLGWGLK